MLIGDNMVLVLLGYITTLGIAIKLKTLNLKNLIISFAPFLILGWVFNFDLSFTYKFTIYFLVTYLSVYVVMTKKKYAIIYSFNLLFITILLHFIFYNVNTTDMFLFSFEPTVFNVITKILISFLSLFILYLLSLKRSFEEEEIHVSEIILGVSIAILLYCVFVIKDLIVNNIINADHFYLIYFLLFASIIIFVLVESSLIIYYDQIQKEKQICKQIEVEEKRISVLLDTKENKNLEQIIKLVNNDNYSQAFELSEEVLQREVRSKKTKHDLLKLENEPIKYLLSSKVSLLRQLNLEIQIGDTLGDIILSKYLYLLEVLGIIIDNAIEAALNSKEQYVKIITSKTNDSTCIEIINTSNSDDITNLKTGLSIRGEKNRLNGLKILSILLERCEMTVIRSVNQTVSYKIFL